jgi:RNase P subunit RPR2
MNKKFSKQEVKQQVEEFFKDIKNKSSKEVKKIKRLAMSKNISLKDNKKLFCKDCFNPYKAPKIRIKKGIKTIICENCEKISRWKIKEEA